MTIHFILIFLLAAQTLFGIEEPQTYQRPPAVSEELWNELQPFFLPIDHPARKKLDALFSNGRPSASFKAMENAGFKCKPLRNWNNTLVAKHPQLKGYIVKLYLDDQQGFLDYPFWVARIHGAEVIRESIERNGYQNLFVVPHKWIYPLPVTDVDVPDRHFILVAEDMQLLSSKENHDRWKSDWPTPYVLKALYTILNDAGLLDSIYVDNIPFTKKGQIAFIDTEHFHKWPVPFLQMGHYLNKKRVKVWNEIVVKNGQI